MKRYRRFLGALLAVALLIGAVPAYAADPDGSLNPETCTGAEFDESVYDEVTTFGTILNLSTNGYEWPSSGTVLVKGSGTNLSMSSLDGVVIPSGLVVDFYRYYKFAGDSDYTYELMTHYDTTNGSATIGSSDSGTSSNSGTVNRPSQTPSDSGNSGNSSTSSEDWGEVEKVFVPGTPSASYDDYYTDVPSTMWAYHPIMTLTKGGLLAGYGNHMFGPNDALTKGQVSIIFTRLLGNPMSGTGSSYAPYSDKTTASRAFVAIWYAGRLNSLGGSYTLNQYETSLVRDSGTTGGLLYSLAQNDKTAIGSMWQAVYDNWRAGLTAGKSTDYISSIDEIPDGDEIRQWIDENWEQMASILHITNAAKYNSVYDRTVAECEAAICRAYNLGMFGGVDSQGTFAPYSPMTRAQMAQILYNMGWTYEGVLDY